MSSAWWITFLIAVCAGSVLALNPDPDARLAGYVGLAVGLGVSGTVDIYRRVGR